MKHKAIYFDNASTKRPYKKALRVQKKIASKYYGNPSSLHRLGREADLKLEMCRSKIANIFNCDSSNIYFTSGGTEGDNQIIYSLLMKGIANGKTEIVTTPIEHHAVSNTLEIIKSEFRDMASIEIKEAKIGENGVVDVDSLKELINENTAFVCMMYINNETGAIQPIKEVGDICFEHGVPLFTDAVQAVGQLNINVKKDNIFALSASAHKFGGPRGIGFVYYKEPETLKAILNGGGQEGNKRSGTQNVPGICAMTVALKKSLKKNRDKIRKLKNYFIEEVLKIPNTFLNGEISKSLYSIANICFKGVDGETMISFLDESGICVSTGSACNSGKVEASKVLLSMGLSENEAKSCIRFSFSEHNTKKEIEYSLLKIKETVVNLRLTKSNKPQIIHY